MDKEMLEEMIKDEYENIKKSYKKIEKYMAMAKENGIALSQQQPNSVKNEIDKIKKEQKNMFEQMMKKYSEQLSSIPKPNFDKMSNTSMPNMPYFGSNFQNMAGNILQQMPNKEKEVQELIEKSKKELMKNDKDK